MMNPQIATLILWCKDTTGLVFRITQFISENQGNIIHLEEHVDTIEKAFFIRVTWDMRSFQIPVENIRGVFSKIGAELNANWHIYFDNEKKNVAIMVSRMDHCLLELLWRYKMGELPINIPLIISNHPDLKPVADYYKIPFYVIPITPETKVEQEKKEVALFEKYEIHTIVLARYMQVLTPSLINKYPNRIINIHHSFLPAFIGGNPYQQAYDRGVKIIGATSHYVTEKLDQGPIIAQDIIQISHKDSVTDLKRKGRDLERLVLARALQDHVEHRIFVNGNRTVIF